tara:strand:- start:508 stop:675 length:168 start_codon:yes stop_codon:yes gene_type:complete
MRKNFPVDIEVHELVIKHLDKIESRGGGRPSITSWTKAAILEKISRDNNRKESKE